MGSEDRSGLAGAGPGPLTAPDRRGSGSFKWDLAAADELPMWVADMDFAVAPAITEALAARLAHPVFGYTGVPRSYRQAVSDWLAARHDWQVSPGELTIVPSVMAAMSLIVDELTEPGDRVVTFAPVYGPFERVVRGQGRELVRVPLAEEETGAGGVRYTLDAQRLADALTDGAASLLLLCSPHNPGGRVWTRGELAAVREVAAAAAVPVLADEIHADLVFPRQQMTPWMAVGPATERDTSLIAPSKTFNIPGLPTATAIAASEAWRLRLRESLEVRKLDLPNLLAMTAAEAAYRHAGGWLDTVRATIHTHYERVRETCAELPGVRVHVMEGTFIAWIDFRERWVASGADAERLAGSSDRFQAHARTHGLWLSSGTEFGPEGEGCMRMNVATSREQLEEGLQRLRTAVATFPGI